MDNKRNWKFWTRRLMICLAFCFMVMAVSGIGTEFVQAASVDDLMYERTFSVQSTKNGNFITGTNGAMASSKTAENVLLLKYGDEGSDWSDNVPVAMYLNTTGAYVTLSTSARVGDRAGVNAALTADGAEQFVLKKAANWSSTYLSYHIYHPQSGLYISVDNNNYLYAYGKTAPADPFVFSKTGYSDVGLLTTLDGYQQLTDDQKMRVLDVYGGIGSRSLFRYGGQGPDWSLNSILSETVKNIYANRDTTTAAEEAQAMLSGMNVNMYSNQTSWYGLPSIIPGTTGVKTVLSEGIPGTYDFWRGTMLSGKQYTFSIIDDYGTHTMDVYIEDNGVAQTNANNLLEAIRQIPYPIRRNIRTIKVRNDGANSYNCGQYDLYMRLNWSPSVNDIAQFITHEFGHSMDFSYNVSGSGSWSAARSADIVAVSDYGSNNDNEDFAEFGRMYFQQYGNYNGMYAIRQLYPNRYARYVQALASAQYEDIYEKLLYLPDAEEETPYDGVIADFTFDDEVEGLRSGTAVANASGRVVLDENGYSGSALYLDGTGSNFLTVLKRDNTSLLSGYDEFTISYYSKPMKNDGNWSVFLAPDTSSPEYQYERYIGVLDKTTSIEAERYNNYGQRSEALIASGFSNQDWRHVVLVVENAQITLYVDGEKIKTVASSDAVEDILGNNGIFQIGKGNWGNGEYYQGYIDELTVYGRALTEAEVQAEGESQIVAQFSFDDTNTGFKGAGAVAVGNGTYQISNENVSGKSLYLDGSGFLNVTKEDGTPLLTGYDELTLSYYSKVESYGPYWSFFLAQDSKGQTTNYENYVGILDRNTNVTVERYNNNGARPTSINVTPENGNEWKHVVVVVESGMTTLYIDGEQVAYVRSEHLLSDITGNNSILQIGKGNWGNGEYFRGYIDEMTIWNGALSAVEIEEFVSDPLLELQVTAPNKTQYQVGDSFDAAGMTVTAVYGSGSVDVTADAVVTGFDSRTAGTKTITVSYGGRTATFDVVVKRAVEGDVLAMFTFDDETSGFTNGYAVAAGNHSLEAHNNGNALYLDGEDDFLKVTTVDGTPLLTGYEEITVSYQAKAEYASENWTFYAAPNDEQQIYPQERYLGILDKNQSIVAERYNNQGSRPANAETSVATDEWHYITVVYSLTDTIIYVNGEEVAREASTYDLPGILGNNSILYIGKGNWNSGEYYKGLIDNYTIIGRALSADEVKSLASNSLQEIRVTAPNKTQYQVGEKFDATGMAVTAVYKNGNVDVTADAVVTGFDSSTEGTKTITVSYGGKVATFDVVVTRRIENDVLAMFTFDDETSGFTNGYAVAAGNHSLEAHGNGNALYLDGEDDFLKVTTVDGAPLLTGYEEITISYQAKAEYASENWLFYAAPNDDQQIYPQEKYIAILDKNQSVIAERFNNQTGRPGAATVTFATDEWYYMTVVYGRTDTIIYLNGEEVAREGSVYDLPGILGNNSILYIGKGNWNGGEYYKGLIDNYTITGRALSAEEVAAAYEALLDQSPVEELPFTDVTEADWFYDAVYYNYSQGLMTGKSATIFAPDASLSRAEFASVLYSANNEPDVTYEATFPDVAESEWYADAVIWANKAGIINGYKNGSFGPYDSVAREQIAVMMYNYAIAKGYDTTQTADLSAFNDGTEVSDYAKEAMQWAVGSGVITGKNGGIRLDAYGSTTRAECAAIMQRFMENCAK